MDNFAPVTTFMSTSFGLAAPPERPLGRNSPPEEGGQSALEVTLDESSKLPFETTTTSVSLAGNLTAQESPSVTVSTVNNNQHSPPQMKSTEQTGKFDSIHSTFYSPCT